jgi:hypothetical protein
MATANTSGKMEAIIKATSNKGSEMALVFGRKITNRIVNLIEATTY